MIVNVKNGEIIYCSAEGKVLVSSFPPVALSFILGLSKEAVSAAADVVADGALIACREAASHTVCISDDLNSLPGFAEHFISRMPRGYSVFSSAASIINSLPEGEFSILTIEEKTSFVLRVEVQGGKFSVIEKRPVENSKLAKGLLRSLDNFILPGTTTARLFEVLFSYKNIFTLNDLINDPVRRVALDTRNFVFSNSPYTAIFNKNLVLRTFFDTLAGAVFDFVTAAGLQGNILVHSPLLAYSPVKSLVDQMDREIIWTDELETCQIRGGHAAIRKNSVTVSVGLECHPENQSEALPFSAWILADANQRLHFTVGQSVFFVDLQVSANRQGQSFFSIANHSLTKYQVFFTDDELGYPRVKVKDMDHNIYYPQIFKTAI